MLLPAVSVDDDVVVAAKNEALACFETNTIGPVK